MNDNPPQPEIWKSPREEDLLLRFAKQLNKVKEDSRSLILVTNGFFELLVETLIKTKCKNAKKITGDSRSYPYSAKLLILHELGYISDEAYSTFDWFRKLRNRAAHEAFFTIIEDDLKVVKDPALRKPTELYRLCLRIFREFWNENIVDLAPVFSPRLVDQDLVKKIHGKRKKQRV